MEFGDFQIETVTFEVRYDPALLLWDKAGAAWAEFVSQFPDLKSQTVNPSQVIFESRNVRAAVELQALRVSCRGANADRQVIEIGQALIRSFCDRLGISAFTRVGFRDIRTRIFPTSEAAIGEISSLIPRPFQSTSISDAKPTSISLSFKHEGEASGLTTALKLDVREIKVTVPWEVKDRIAESFPKEHVMSLDSDYFTIGTTRRETLSVEDWIRQANRTIVRHWKGVLG